MSQSPRESWSAFYYRTMIEVGRESLGLTVRPSQVWVAMRLLRSQHAKRHAR